MQTSPTSKKLLTLDYSRALMCRTVERYDKTHKDLEGHYLDCNGDPVCIVAAALKEDGFDIEILRQYEGYDPSMFLNLFYKSENSAVIDYWNEVQEYNDAGYRWSDIVS